MMRRLYLTFALTALGGAAAFAGGWLGPRGSSGPIAQTITSVTVSPSSPSFVAFSQDGTHVASITTTMSMPGPPFIGVSTVNNIAFRVVGSNLVTNGVQSQPSYTGVIVTSTPTDTTIAPASSAPFTVVTTPAPPSQTIASINLSNAQFQAGPGSAGTFIGHVTVTMSQAPAFSGSLSQDNGNLVLVNTGTTTTPCTLSECDLRVGIADLPATTPATTYPSRITATPSDTTIPPFTQLHTITGLGPPGSVVTTYTLQNASASIIPAGTVYIAGQGFRRGDFPPGTYPVFQDAGTHAPLVQQLDEIATRRENGDDNSIRHLVFSVQLPSAVPANGTYTMEIIKQTGTYTTPATKQTLAALCAAHTLKLDFTDVRNQAGTVRDSGHMTFDVCANIGNTGRDAPRHLAQGPVRDTYIVRGAPVYATSGNKDPLIYVEATLDLTTLASDQTSLGSVRHVMRVMSPWMNTRAGSVGNSGAPGPVGFTNDPQAISYRPQLLDGSTNLLDWSWWDNTVASGDSPVVITGGDPGPTGCQSGPNGSHTATSTGNITLPGSTGANTLQYGTALWYTTTGNPPSGLNDQTLYFTDGVNILYSGVDPNNTKKIHLATVPAACEGSGFEVNPTSQGTGNHTFAYRVWHPKWLAWWTVDQNAADNWTSGTNRTTSPLLPAFTPSEITYWEQSGNVPPLKITPPVDTNLINHGSYEWIYYAPMAINNMGGLGGTGDRPQLALTSEYFTQAFLLETPEAWRLARLAALSQGTWSFGSTYDERTARTPAMNNGSPAANHGGSGTAYTDGSLTIPLLAGTVDILDGAYMDGLTQPLQSVPVADYSGYAAGVFGSSRHFSTDHYPSWSNGTLQVLGNRHYYDLLYTSMFSAVASESIGDLHGYHQTDTLNGVRYYGLHVLCCQIRGSYWASRDKGNCAAYGADSATYERRYCQDMMLENYYYYRALEAFTDAGCNCSGISALAVIPNLEKYNSAFKDAYGMMVNSYLYGIMRDPSATYFIPKFIRVYGARCAANDPTGYPSAYWCASYNWMENITDTSQLANNDFIYDAGHGHLFVNDLSEMGEAPSYMWIYPVNDGTINMRDNDGDFPGLLFSNGDLVKPISTQAPGQNDNPDQLSPAVWYTITNLVKNPSGSPRSFKLINPSTGTPFTSFTTYGGSPIGYVFYLKTRPMNAADNPPTGFQTLGYTRFVIPGLKGFRANGFTGVDAALGTVVARGYTDAGGASQKTSWDQNVVVP